MDPQDILQSVLNGALSGRRKGGSRAWRAATGGRNPLLNASTLLTLGGLAWGVYETMTKKPDGFAGQAPSAAPPAVPPATAAPSAGPPPLPTAGSPGIPENLRRILRLMISAARADGTLHDSERQAILEHAQAVGVGPWVKAEVESARPLGEILEGVADPNLKRELYVLAFTIVRADGQVSGAERIYLAQLAHRLGLTADEVKGLEDGAAARIDSEQETEGA